MKPTYRCNYCKEEIEVDDADPNMSALEHLSAVHGVVIGAIEGSSGSKELNDAITAHLVGIKGSKINN